MKRLLIIDFLMSITLYGYTEEQGVFMEINLRNKPDAYTKVNRSPLRISLDVVFETETKLITITGNEPDEVEVFLYNTYNEIEDYSTLLNTNLSVSTSGLHRILIECSEWSAEGVIEI